MSRASTDFVTACLAGHLRPVPLLDVHFAAGWQYVSALDHAVDWAGHTYTPTYGCMSIGTTHETGDSYEGLQIQISGVTASSIALALTERVQGREIVLRLGLVTDTGLVVDDNAWSGLMDVLSVSDGADGNAVIVIRAEHVMATWDRPRVGRYTDADQQARHFGDGGCRHAAALESAVFVWPSADFFKV